MKRDMDKVRTCLLLVEKQTAPGMVEIVTDENPFTSPSPLFKHFDLLIEAGFLRGEVRNTGGGGGRDGEPAYHSYYFDVELTWRGHEFLDTIRDEEIWRRTKDGAKKIGGASVEFLWEIAKAYGKQMLKEHAGLDLA